MQKTNKPVMIGAVCPFIIADSPRKGKDNMKRSAALPQKPASAPDGVIYARYSSHSQRDVAIEQQVRECERFAARNGIRIVGTYEDRALTGTNDRRPGFQKMMKDAESGGWAYVIVYSLDRFARDRYDSAVYKRQLKNCGVKVLSAMENISDDPSGILMESLLEGLAEYYSKELSQKIRRGMADNASKCMVNGSLPLGYVRGEDGRYAINEAEAETVRSIFQRVKKGDRICDIIRDLNSQGIRTKTGREWNKSSFNAILSNERYTGVYIYGDFRFPGGIPPIVSQELYDAVQYAVSTKPNPRAPGIPQKRRREDSVYLLTGRLFCGHCKKPMVGISGTSKQGVPHYYYVCKGKRTEHSCQKKNVPRERVESLIATALRDTMLTDKAISVLADAAIAYQSQSADNAQVEALRNRMAEITKSINNLISAMEAGIFSASTQSRLAELEAEKRDVTAQLSAAQERASQQLSRQDIVTILKMFQDGDVSDKHYQEAMIDTFLVAAYVYDDHIKIVFKVGSDKKEASLPFDIDDVDLSDNCTSSAPLHQPRKFRFIKNRNFFIFLFTAICWLFIILETILYNARIHSLLPFGEVFNRVASCSYVPRLFPCVFSS